MNKKNPNLTAEQKLVMFEEGTEEDLLICGRRERNREEKEKSGRESQVF